jgi:ergothioneine biosynthesis protein EgtB
MVDYLGRENQWSHGLLKIVELGLHHEQQHQELMLTDIKNVLSCNPLFPAHVEGAIDSTASPQQRWIEFSAGLHEIGHGSDKFAFDNESPRHRVFLEPFELSSRLVTNGEFLEFIEDGGYARPNSWLSIGWSHVNQQGWDSPLYWLRRDDRWFEFTLGGLKELDLSLPATHLSYFEADAYARWSGARLATESEWEIASADQSPGGMSAEDYFDSATPVHPTHSGESSDFWSLFGSTWQWTSSSYSAYPGYRPISGALGEYNGKFMCNQYVLRGSSCATSRDHTRRTYRNFFPPDARWQFTGIRLARS